MMIPFVKFYNTPHRENKALSMSSTGYGIHIHEPSRFRGKNQTGVFNYVWNWNQDNSSSVFSFCFFGTKIKGSSSKERTAQHGRKKLRNVPE
jgi:hypothetical protein